MFTITCVLLIICLIATLMVMFKALTLDALAPIVLVVIVVLLLNCLPLGHAVAR